MEKQACRILIEKIKIKRTVPPGTVCVYSGHAALTEFTESVITALKRIPSGKVCTYGGIAAIAGNPSGARQVVRILNSMSAVHNLPWHRIINSRGCIAIRDEEGFLLQKALLEQEGIAVSEAGAVDLNSCLWHG